MVQGTSVPELLLFACGAGDLVACQSGSDHALLAGSAPRWLTQPAIARMVANALPMEREQGEVESGSRGIGGTTGQQPWSSGKKAGGEIARPTGPKPLEM